MKRNAEVGFYAMLESHTVMEQGSSLGFISHLPAGTAVEADKVFYGNPGIVMRKRGMESRDQVISLTGFDWLIRILISLIVLFVWTLAALFVAVECTYLTVKLAVDDVSLRLDTLYTDGC